MHPTGLRRSQSPNKRRRVMNEEKGDGGGSQQASSPSASASASASAAHAVVVPAVPAADVATDSGDALPIAEKRDEILKAVEENQVVILMGETGSGKTTQVPIYLHHAGYTSKGVIAITQPRRVAAITVAHRVAQELSSQVGDLVGYSVRFEDVTSAATKIRFATDGFLLRDCVRDGDFSRYSVLILDEAHERTLATDMLFGLVKRLLVAGKRPQLRVIVMSATLDPSKYGGFFRSAGVVPLFGGARGRGAGGVGCVRIVRIPGRQHPVEIFHTPAAEEDYVEAASITVMQLHVEQPPGDILVFLPGQDDIEALQQLLEDKRVKLDRLRRHPSPSDPLPPSWQSSSLDMLICPIYAALPVDQQVEAFRPTPPHTRKVVLATNIAETSITLPGIRYVVDSGKVKLTTFNPRTGVEMLLRQDVSKAAAMQRSGRAGREAPGQAYRLFTEADSQGLADQTPPEITRADLAQIVLQMRAYGISNEESFPFLDAPKEGALDKAVKMLQDLGALDNRGLTDLGHRLSGLPVVPMHGRLLLDSMEFGCLEHMLSIVALLSTENVWHHTLTSERKADKERRKRVSTNFRRLAHPDGDHLTLLKAYHRWNEVSDKVGFCKEHGINHHALVRATKIREQLQGLLVRLLGDVDMAAHTQAAVGKDEQWVSIKQCLAKAFFLNAAKLMPPTRKYRTEYGRQEVHVHPTSVLVERQSLPQWVVYNDFFQTGVGKKLYIKTVTAVEGEWLVQFAPAKFTAAYVKD
ncbi:unnamed protein product [Vitrella brassicaformis CCMP3155]|uniref:RNA helicase n=1 Tax=Vitrella brassicaformis (strain CCMP3155) TaxID=1169540 RepID=A0A0G4FFR8_VITBC|nr:unnamed protein product [Vitrella brassicaformis CCMP3155]|eukprot:CEM12062.1 unnamed protein product [Vitrella brassicaformis CCMP3155]